MLVHAHVLSPSFVNSGKMTLNVALLPLGKSKVWRCSTLPNKKEVFCQKCDLKLPCLGNTMSTDTQKNIPFFAGLKSLCLLHTSQR